MRQRSKETVKHINCFNRQIYDDIDASSQRTETNGMENRKINYKILTEIQERWSPRAFDINRGVDDQDLMALLEAARYAPSCFNEQPWRFIVAKEPEIRAKMLSVLSENNQKWASKAPVLILLLAKQMFEKIGKTNRWHLFDAGAAWGYFSLEAQRRGLITHAMGGFNVTKARETFAIPEDYDLIAVVAVGYYGNKADLAPENLEREKPGLRKETKELLVSFPN
jgi:nitroreductase